jgi:hypothetical protein
LLQHGPVGWRGQPEGEAVPGRGGVGDLVEFQAMFGLQREGVLVAELPVEVRDALNVRQVAAALPQASLERLHLRPDQPPAAVRLQRPDNAHLPRRQRHAAIPPRPGDQAQRRDHLAGAFVLHKPEILEARCRVVK